MDSVGRSHVHECDMRMTVPTIHHPSSFTKGILTNTSRIMPESYGEQIEVNATNHMNRVRYIGCHTTAYAAPVNYGMDIDTWDMFFCPAIVPALKRIVGFEGWPRKLKSTCHVAGSPKYRTREKHMYHWFMTSGR